MTGWVGFRLASQARGDDWERDEKTSGREENGRERDINDVKQRIKTLERGRNGRERNKDDWEQRIKTSKHERND
jgi:hypothetical protein